LNTKSIRVTIEHTNQKEKALWPVKKMSNTFGSVFRITTFGESHGKAIGGIIDGCPAGVLVQEEMIQRALERRKPGQSEYTSPRKEDDKVEILSGVFEGKTLGTPISFIIQNKDYRSSDYDLLKDVYRPSHADYTYNIKYGHRDYRGGGRSSARSTASVVVAGAIARQLVLQFSKAMKPTVLVWVNQIGHITAHVQSERLHQEDIYASPLRCTDNEACEAMAESIRQVKLSGDSLGGIIQGEIKDLMPGLGEPLFNKFQAALASAMFSINAVHGFEYGLGFSGAAMMGSQSNDSFEVVDNNIQTKTNFSGGVQGGITNGMPVSFRVAFKPTATISQSQHTINSSHETIELKATGRHDPCVLPRAVSIVEAFCWMVIADMMLLNKHARV
jgi:chorismate synthase